MRLTTNPVPTDPASSQSSRTALLTGLPIAEILLDVLVQSPDATVNAALKQINARIGPTMKLYFIAPGKPQPGVPDGQTALTHALRGEAPTASLTLMMPLDEEEPAARHMLAQLAMMFGKLQQLGERHNSMQRMLIHDELTGVYNSRYFKHFLNRICEKSRVMKFPVTLLLFDIDNFKKYNDQYGHGVGDDILKATAALMKQCTREHDVVARISGDEFAVIFWEKEGPRQPRDPRHHASGRVPSTPQVIFERFRRLLHSAEAHEKYSVLGTTGKGTLTISGGMAVYPFDARTPEELIARADEALMFGAKKCGKDSLYLVGGQNGSAANDQD
jgi:GGDEF domain-containing protein